MLKNFTEWVHWMEQAAFIMAINAVSEEVKRANVESENRSSEKVEVKNCLNALSETSAAVRQSENRELAESKTKGLKIQKGIESVVAAIPRGTLNRSQGNSILRSAKFHTNENLHSNIIASLLNYNESGHFALRFFNEILKSLRKECDESYNSFQFSRREVLLGELGNDKPDIANRKIDIIVQREKHILVIENKIFSTESANQTEDYETAVNSSAKFKGKKRTFILLSPYGGSGSSVSFQGMSYEKLFFCLERAINVETSSPLPSFYRNELANILTDFYT